MSAKLTSADAVIRALASGSGLTGPEIARVTGLGRSTVSKALVALERHGPPSAGRT
jgi:DNA-binding IclR family transcriptional regulator